MNENMKNKIIDAWIMVENLSEGNINLKDKSIRLFKKGDEKDFYNLFLSEIAKEKIQKNGGIGIYFEVFNFEKVKNVLQKFFNIEDTDEDLSIGDKFSIAIFLDKDLKIYSEKTFVSSSYYILKENKIPIHEQFFKFENEIKNKINEIFNFYSEENYPKEFNNAIFSILDEYGFTIDNLRYKILRHIENEVSELHSFFISDLEKAKEITHKNLDDYLLGNFKNRIDLSIKDNSDIFKEILQPIKYPLTRFPSNPKYFLSLMQQMAVNIATNYNESISSVNGPPGTGKTTLLKDIFSYHIVEQAFHICKWTDKIIKGSKETIYNSTEKTNYSIGILPDLIANHGIVVASSNNGAVKNIVNELPLYDSIDSRLIDDIRKADYFTEIANSNLKIIIEKDENNKSKEKLIKEKKDNEINWGLFSCEGGKSENMSNIIKNFKFVVDYLYKEHNHNPDVYEEFNKKYQELQKYREKIHSIYLKCKNLNISKKNINELREKIKLISDEIKFKNNEIEKINEIKIDLQQNIEIFNKRKFSIFSLLFSKDKRNENKKNKLQKVIYENKLLKLNEQKSIIRNELLTLNNNLIECEYKIDEIEKLSLLIEKEGISILDLTKDYSNLQLDNPWFNEEYREKQSLLFISALKVRKEFLYENKHNLKAALYIWNNQNNIYERKNYFISEAWKWINLVIPVISSTFASISRMCKNFEENTIANLFVDEAGQALPQASVGAIFRSKKIIVVGDPSQIEPVLTLNSSILSLISKHFSIPDKYLSAKTSTQSLIDTISKYGFYKDKELNEWIGIPLWVHRRCLSPMFDVSNKISYDGNMVQANNKLGKMEWFDIGGVAINKYVKEQGEFLKNKIQEMINENPNIIDEIYVISPFRNVAFHLSKILTELNDGIKFTKYEKGKPKNVGTVHTFQGKEAKIVFFVLGADQNSKGAANWAVGSANPNIMNVAVTRAKQEFYIIGDKNLYKSLGSKVINDTLNIIENYNK